jgi:hypothetical protein
MPSNTPFPDQVPFVPRSSYITNKLAPEKIPKAVVIEAAKATKKAVDAGVITPELAKYVLPNLLTENRADYGINDGGFYSKNPNVKKVIEALGLQKSVISKEQAAAIDAEDAKLGIRKSAPTKGDMLQVLQGRHPGTAKQTVSEQDEIAANAMNMVTVLGIKAGEAGGDPLETIRRWNGAGPGAENHKRKVIEVSGALSLPQNKQVVELFNQYYNNPEGK